MAQHNLIHIVREQRRMLGKRIDMDTLRHAAFTTRLDVDKIKRARTVKSLTFGRVVRF